MKKTNYTQRITQLVLFLIVLYNPASVSAQCNFSAYNTIKIVAGSSSILLVDEVPNYQASFEWDFSEAPASLSFFNETATSIEVSADPTSTSANCWLKYSYTDIGCVIEDSIQIELIGTDQFSFSEPFNVICPSDENTPISLQTDLTLTGIELDILDVNQNLLFNNISTWPSGMQQGTYLMEVSWGEFVETCPTCLVISNDLIQVPFYFNADASGVMSCNDNLKVSVNENCEIDISADLLLENVSGADWNASIISFYDGMELVDLVNSDYIGETLDFIVEDICSGNSCMGSITIEDKIAPVFATQDLTVNQFCGGTQSISEPVSIDNCNGPVTIQLVSSDIQNFNCSSQNGLISLETRLYKATDASGNISESFEQEIYTRIPTLGEIDFPSDLNDIQAPSLNCQDSDKIAPEFTGYPSAFGVDFIPGEDYCGITLNYSDQVLNGCGDGFTILRTWVILRTCNGDSEWLEHEQIISVKDKIAPYLECFDFVEVDVLDSDCVLTDWAPQVVVMDDCSSVEWTVSGDNWIVNGGESLPDLALGSHLITFIASDNCGNQTQCNAELIVKDGLSPTAICLLEIDASLNTDGIAIVDAYALDEGSFDNCSSELFYQVRRMDGEYSEQLLVDCDDLLEGVVNVELAVWDETGNKNTCMAQIYVDDKIGPEITCSSVDGFDCTDLSHLDDLWGGISFSDNCNHSISFGEVDLSDLNTQCYTGSVKREVTVVDGAGNTSSCNQIINFSGIDVLNEAEIEWPDDLFFESCSGVSYDPDSIGLDVGFPEISKPNCALIAVNYSDQLFYTGGEECFKVLRSWTVIDWCHYDVISGFGSFNHLQEIKVQDDQAPVVDCNIVPFVKLNTPDCFGEITFDLPYIIEECSDLVTIDVSSILGEGAGPFQDVGLGSYMVTYTISDACGNTTSCLVDYMVSDAKEPTAYCVDELIIDLPEELEVDIVASDFDFASFDNCTQEEELYFAFSSLGFDSIRTFDCTNLGLNELQMFVFDAEGNFDRCNVHLDLQDNNNFCGNNLLSLSGVIADRFDDPLVGVNVISSGAFSDTIISQDDGYYQFDEVVSGSDYTLSAEYTDPSSISNSVTTFDIVMITKHILGQEVFQSPYQWIAADVNDSGTISTLDLVAIRKVILQIEPTFPNNKRWKFIDRSHIFSGSTNPLSNGYPELINLNNLTDELIDLDFVAVRMGDVN